MNRHKRWTSGRPSGWLIGAFIIATAGCSPGESADVGATGLTEIKAESSTDEPGSLPERDTIDDPAARARIEHLTRDAMESLVRAADFLAEQSSFSVVADVSFDAFQSDGRMLEFGSRREMTVRRPGRFRMREDRRDGDTRTVYFDGTTISMDLPGHQAFVQIEAPGTLYAALEHLSEEVGAPVPLADLFSENLAAPLEDRVESGYYVGPAAIGGRLCEHLSFRLPEVDVQFWVEEGDRPLIARIVISHKLEEGNPQFRATLHDWDLAVETPESFFHFEPAEGIEHLAVGALDGSKMPGAEGAE